MTAKLNDRFKKFLYQLPSAEAIDDLCLPAEFEKSVQTEESTGLEFWLARELQKLLGYSQWRSFESVIDKSIDSCITAGYDSEDHFARVRKMVDLGSGAKREIDDIAIVESEILRLRSG